MGFTVDVILDETQLTSGSVLRGPVWAAGGAAPEALREYRGDTGINKEKRDKPDSRGREPGDLFAGDR